MPTLSRLFYYRMRIRIFSFLFCSSLCVATFILIYQIWNLPSEFRPGYKKREDVTVWESRMKQLEEDINSNHNTIKEIKLLIKSLAISNPESNYLLDNTPNNELTKLSLSKFDRGPHISVLSPAFNITKTKIHQDDCIFSQSPSSSVDLQMKNIYDVLPFDNPDGGAWKQGWDISVDPSQWSLENKLKVFVVPHSHNDPGWIKTFEKYFEDQTRHILDNMVIKLTSDHRMKFIWAEISFFSLWWDRQSVDIKDSVKRLVETGQLEIVTGGWVMPDESNTHYSAMVNQLLTGHEWLQLNLAVKPNNGWAIDPFGLSPTMGYILKRSGVENMVIQRVHYSVKKHLAKEKNLEFRWRQIWDTDASTDILCHMMPFYGYDVPHSCGPDPKVCCQFDFRRLPGGGLTCPWRVPPQPINVHNVESRARLLLDQYQKKAQLYRTNVLLVQLGDDFRYDKLEEWDAQFENYQRLFDFMNGQEEMHFQGQFGTLADYFRALREETAEEKGFFPSLSGDFFTYADRDHHYWSGYFTTRPFYKRMERIFLSYLRSAEILYALMLESETKTKWTRHSQEVAYALMDSLSLARRYHGLFQHHDGITGTSKNHVAVDYAKKMLAGIRTSQHIIQQAAYLLLSNDQSIGESDDESSVYFELEERYQEHNSIASKIVMAVSPNNTRKIFIFNPEGHKRTHLMTIRVNTPYIQMKDKVGGILLCQVDPVFNQIGVAVINEYDVHFVVTLDALSLTLYTIVAVESSEINPRSTTYSEISTKYLKALTLPDIFLAKSHPVKEPLLLEMGHLKAKFDANGLLQRISSRTSEVDVHLQFITYDSVGGAYLFLPRGPAREYPIHASAQIIVRGSLLSSLRLYQAILQHQVILKNSPGVDGLAFEINNYVDIRKEHNFELGMRLTTPIQSDTTFYTDLNGFQIIKRTRYAKLPVQGNVYPMGSQMFIEDRKLRVSLHSAQPLGCTSLTSGQMDVILDRELAQDDERGLGHGITDNVLTLNKFRLLVEKIMEPMESTLKAEIQGGYASLTSHAVSFLLLHPSLLLEHVVKGDNIKDMWSVGGELPCDVEVMNLRSLLTTRQPGAAYPPSSTLALILHRSAFSCLQSNDGLHCSTTNGKVRLRDLFPSSYSEEVKQMSLTHLYDGVDMTMSYTLALRPMELYSYKLFLSSPK